METPKAFKNCKETTMNVQCHPRIFSNDRIRKKVYVCMCVICA